NMERFSSLGVIENYPCRDKNEILSFFEKMETLFERNDFKKEEIVSLLKEFIPNFEHEEKGKNLDQKM
ncbi:MAG: nucleoside-diphosphate sugar epimerase, partial [Bacteroidales bacterium]|nr:nucleoside-diphosphate sugar epimerase [Bacteroidales bacterium]